jgi:hypothetical protein
MELDLSVTVKMCEKAALFGPPEVDGQDATTRIQDPPDFPRTQLASDGRQVVEH